MIAVPNALIGMNKISDPRSSVKSERPEMVSNKNPLIAVPSKNQLEFPKTAKP